MATQVKHRVVVEAQPAPVVARLAGPTSPGVHIVATKVGPLTFLDKLKGYYHTLIAVVAAVLLFLNQVTPIADFLPPAQRHWFSLGVVIVGGVLTFLKSNEHWVDGGMVDTPPEAAA